MVHEMKHFPTVLVLSYIVLFYGCAAVGPDYVRPDVPVSKDWRAASPMDQEKQQTNHQRLAVWWRAFNDPMLVDLMERAVAGNRNLKRFILLILSRIMAISTRHRTD